MAVREIITLNESTPQLIAPPAGDTASLPITLNAATGNEIALDIQYTTNKATSGNDTGLLINQTDTASPGTSLLLDLQVGGTTKFKVTNVGLTYSFGGYSFDSWGSLTSNGWENILAGASGTIFNQTVDHTRASSFSFLPTSGKRLTAASGTQSFISISPDINQTSTAGYTGILLNVTETATGSGSKLLMDLQVGGVSQFKVANNGDLTVGSGGFIRMVGASSVINMDSTNIYVAPNGQNAFRVGTGDINWKQYTNSTASDVIIFDQNAGVDLQASSGTQAYLSLKPIFNHTSTAGYTGILLNVTETATGSGSKLLMDLQVGGVSKASVAPGGTVSGLDYRIDNSASYTIAKASNALQLRGHFGNIFAHGADLTSGDAFTFKGLNPGIELAASSGTQAFMKLAPEINQTSTAGYTGILLNVTETATGSGSNLLMDLQVGGVSKFYVASDGITYNAQGIFALDSGNQINFDSGTCYIRTDNVYGLKVQPTLLTVVAGSKIQVDRTTEDAAFINFKATADADATSAISTLTTSGSTSGHLQIEVNGTTAWVAYSTTDPT